MLFSTDTRVHISVFGWEKTLFYLAQPSLAQLLRAGRRTAAETDSSRSFMLASRSVWPVPKVSRWKAAAPSPAGPTRPGAQSVLSVKVGIIFMLVCSRSGLRSSVTHEWFVSIKVNVTCSYLFYFNFVIIALMRRFTAYNHHVILLYFISKLFCLAVNSAGSILMHSVWLFLTKYLYHSYVTNFSPIRSCD